MPQRDFSLPLPTFLIDPISTSSITSSSTITTNRLFITVTVCPLQNPLRLALVGLPSTLPQTQL
jgi:hypothetical protein